MSLWKQLPVQLTERERFLIAFRFANPQLSIRQINQLLLLQPGELSRLATAQGRPAAALEDLAHGRTVLPWREYRIWPKLYLRAVTEPEK